MRKRVLLLIAISIFSSSVMAENFSSKKTKFTYSMSTDKPVNYQIDLKTEKKNCYTELTVADKSGKNKMLKANFHMNKRQEATFNIGVKAGSYVLQYMTLSSCGDATFDLKLTRVTGNFEQEENNDIANATPIIALKYFYGYLQSYKDVDYYKVDLPAKGMFNLEFNHEKIKTFAHYQIDIIDSNNKVLLTYINPKDVLKTDNFFGLNKGTYFIRVKRDSSSTGLEHHEYKLAYTFSKNNNIEIMPNKKLSQATPINDGLYITGYFNLNGKDYYQYKAKKGKFSLVYEHKAIKKDTIIEISDSNKKLIKRFIGKGSKEKEYFDFEVKNDDTIYVKMEYKYFDPLKDASVKYKFGIIKSK